MNLFSIVSASAVGILSAVILTATGWSTMHSSDFADLVVRNAKIFTFDSTLPLAEAMAVRKGRILRLGSYSSVQDLISAKTLEVNLERKVVVPGFIDSHVHFLNGGLQMLQLQLQKIRSQSEFVRNIKQAVEDGHMGLANLFALKMAKIINKTKDPIGGTVLRSSDGEPTGVLVDTAMKLVVSLIPEISIDERRRALVRASRHALSRGITTVADFGRFLPGASVDHVWQEFSDVYKWANSINEDLVKKNGKPLSENIYLGSVKTFADGSLGSRSALFYEIAIHAIGDKANDMILDLYDSIVSLNVMKDRRLRVEHAQHLASGTAARFGK